MEEDIKLLEKLEFIAYGKKEDIEALGTNINVEKLDTTKIIRNLINKYKEQEEQINLTERVQQNYKNAFYEKSIENTKLRDKIYEQEKIIELMAEYIDFDKIDLNCTSLCVKDNCREQCIIDYFKKKARDENGNKDSN